MVIILVISYQLVHVSSISTCWNHWREGTTGGMMAAWTTLGGPTRTLNQLGGLMSGCTPGRPSSIKMEPWSKDSLQST